MKIRIVFLMAVFACTNAWAQYAHISGSISDPVGAVVPNADVTATNIKTGVDRRTETNNSGIYNLLSLAPGEYEVQVKKEGFQIVVRSNLVLTIGEQITLNFTLKLGETSQSVTIDAAGEMLQTADAVTGQVINRKFINDLPLIDRSVLSLAYLTPGVVSNGVSGINNFISNGSRNATADVLIDGATATNFEQNGGIQTPSYTPSVEAVEEFKVQQSNFSAEYGFSGATVVNMVTRSGTNEFHGSFYEFLRNNKLDANNFFANASGQPISAQRRNVFGATVGGPIRKNKTFFFFDFDGTRRKTAATKRLGVPSAEERNGNFGELCAAQGGMFDATGRCSEEEGQLWDPYSGVYDPSLKGPVRSGYIPFNNLTTYQSPGNPKLDGTGRQLPAGPGNLIDPVAAKMMQFYPMPNVNVGNSLYDRYSNWFGQGTDSKTVNQWDLKIDQQFSERDVLSGKFSRLTGGNRKWNCLGNMGDNCTAGPHEDGANLAALNEVHTFSPNVLLNVSYGYNRIMSIQPGIRADYEGFNPVTMLGMPDYILRSGFAAFPEINLDNYSGTIGSRAYSIYKQGQDTHQLRGSLSWIKGSHELKFGAEGRKHYVNWVLPGATGGSFEYSFRGSSQYPDEGGGDDMASFLMGIGSGDYNIPVYVSTANYQVGGFIQDNWKVNRNLTLNIGLRYDTTLPRTERYNQMNWLDPDVVSPVRAPGLATLHGGEIFADPKHRSNYDPDLMNFQPRFGFAWNAGKFVVRGGYGIFYSTTKAGSSGPGGGGFQGFDQTTDVPETYQNDGATPWGRLSDPFPVTGPKYPPGNSLGLWNDIGFDARGPIRAYKNTPQEQTWSLGIQREMPWNILVDAAYVGKKGTHLYFGGAAEYNRLGPEIENYSAAQIKELNGMVPNPFYGIITDPNSELSSSTVRAYQLRLPFPQFTSFGGDAPPWANSSYHAFQLKADKRFSSGLQFLFSYTFSKSIDDASVTDENVEFLGGSIALQNPNNRQLERSVSTFDITHVAQFSYTYEFPFGRGKQFGTNWHPAVNAFLGGWQTNGMWRIDSGRPLTVGLRGGTTLPTYGSQRPDLVGRPERNNGSDWMTHYFTDNSVFIKPAAYALGNAPRTLPWVRLPGGRDATLSLFKEFSLAAIREGMRTEFRVEASNALNHPVFSGPNTSFGSSSFGRVTSQANSPRQVQLGLKLYW